MSTAHQGPVQKETQQNFVIEKYVQTYYLFTVVLAGGWVGLQKTDRII